MATQQLLFFILSWNTWIEFGEDARPVRAQTTNIDTINLLGGKNLVEHFIFVDIRTKSARVCARACGQVGARPMSHANLAITPTSSPA